THSALSFPTRRASDLNPTSVIVSSGSTGPSTISVSGFNGFTGTVSLTTTVSPSTGLTCTLSPTSIALGSITSGTSTLSCAGTLRLEEHTSELQSRFDF